MAMESPHGFGKLYVCRYGPYLVGMNLAADAPTELDVPAGAGEAVDLISGMSMDRGRPVSLPPQSSVVLLLTAPGD